MLLTLMRSIILFRNESSCFNRGSFLVSFISRTRFFPFIQQEKVCTQNRTIPKALFTDSNVELDSNQAWIILLLPTNLSY